MSSNYPEELKLIRAAGLQVAFDKLFKESIKAMDEKEEDGKKWFLKKDFDNLFESVVGKKNSHAPDIIKDNIYDNGIENDLIIQSDNEVDVDLIQDESFESIKESPSKQEAEPIDSDIHLQLKTNKKLEKRTRENTKVQSKKKALKDKKKTTINNKNNNNNNKGSILGLEDSQSGLLTSLMALDWEAPAQWLGHEDLMSNWNNLVEMDTFRPFHSRTSGML